jgi:hypothetical protein
MSDCILRRFISKENFKRFWTSRKWSVWTTRQRVLLWKVVHILCQLQILFCYCRKSADESALHAQLYISTSFARLSVWYLFIYIGWLSVPFHLARFCLHASLFHLLISTHGSKEKDAFCTSFSQQRDIYPAFCVLDDHSGWSENQALVFSHEQSSWYSFCQPSSISSGTCIRCISFFVLLCDSKTATQMPYSQDAESHLV